MDRGRRAEPYSNATIWTREVARNLAGHLERLSKVHSCVDTASPKSSQFKHPVKRIGQVSPIKFELATAPHVKHKSDGDEFGRDGDGALSIQLDPSETGGDGGELQASMGSREELGTPASADASRKRNTQTKPSKKKKSRVRTQLKVDHEESSNITQENQGLQDMTVTSAGVQGHPDHSHGIGHETAPSGSAQTKKLSAQDYHKRKEQHKIWQENQALAKRLRNTKPTLSSKDWEKDDKWNQQFLKTHEKRRQALQHEMARTLASPHSALIRVKHVASHDRSDHHSVGDLQPGDGEVTAIEVTTGGSDCGGSTARDLRRRRSMGGGGDPVGGGDRRHHSTTAANHRRILELRKQKEERQVLPPTSPPTTSGDGPPDELVSVRFTFSRPGSQETSSLSGRLCTPSGITGQFSPAIELETALESAWGGADEDGGEMLPVPILEPPTSSRLDGTDVDAVVLMVLQGCIDMVVHEHRQVHDCSLQDSPVLTEFKQKQGIEETDDHIMVALKLDTSTLQDPTPVVEDSRLLAVDQDEQLDEYAADDFSVDAVRSIDVGNHGDASQFAAHDMETSGYGSEFDVEDGAHCEETVVPLVPVDEVENVYEDDADAGTLEPEPSDQTHVADAHDQEDTHYEDDLEPEGDATVDPVELSYSEDGFAGDE